MILKMRGEKKTFETQRFTEATSFCFLIRVAEVHVSNAFAVLSFGW
jgi:hypothetical protein